MTKAYFLFCCKTKILIKVIVPSERERERGGKIERRGGCGGEGGREGGRETLADSSREGGWTGNNRERRSQQPP